MIAKIRLSERNAKEKALFFCFAEREYLKSEGLKVRISEQNPKENAFSFGLSNEST